MYSTKINIQQLTSLLIKSDIRKVVVCPGSRNAALVHNFMEAGLECFNITDERSAGFFALGLIEANNCQPVAVCCTSGSAVLNLAPAIAEAYYKPLPLVVITADRPQEWIGQKDGQTMIQTTAFNDFIRKSASLPEPKNEDERWYCNRLINEALIELHKTNGPVHINVPITEPLFDFTAETLPDERIITLNTLNSSSISKDTIDLMNKAERPMIILGQMHSKEIKECAEYLMDYASKGWVILAEVLSNAHIIDGLRKVIIGNFDELLANKQPTAPDLVVTLGGHIVSKRLKKYIRANKPVNHIHVNPNVEAEDLFQCMTVLHAGMPKDFLAGTIKDINNPGIDYSFSREWVLDERTEATPILDNLFKEITENTESFKPDAIGVANSSMVRKIQTVNIGNIPVLCNRGINGIEGSISSVIGYWAGSKENTLLLTGDLSFFYDQNALWNNYVKSSKHNSSLRILIINNGGGKIFYGLPGLKSSPYLSDSIAAAHTTTAKGIAEECGIMYIEAHSFEEYKEKLKNFLEASADIRILEVFTDSY